MHLFYVRANVLVKYLYSGEYMSVERAKQALENYIYDYQYFLEKSKERENFKDEVQNSIVRTQLLNEYVSNQGQEEAIYQIVENERQEEKYLTDILKKKQSIENIIKNLPQPYMTILYFRYMRFFSFGQIADKMHYSTKRIYQLHMEGLKLFAEIYDENNLTAAKLGNISTN